MLIIKDKGQPVDLWTPGKVTETHPRADGLVRVVVLQPANGLKKIQTVKLMSKERNRYTNSEERKRSEMKCMVLITMSGGFSNGDGKMQEKGPENVEDKCELRYIVKKATINDGRVKDNQCVKVFFDEGQPTGLWNIGKIIETHPRDDETVRVVVLQTANGLKKRETCM
ncbi:hypothetical protein HNY73_021501 [Argiope bruennichi]|uniref:DUF5641 domain-containing protein n=1 Tax=Argiope bruennichi TaxID=94029 RepID=A0A8T0E036_ARGBR|nr:hypothetical protein HNY73_021501 [Argiope bruennichi]